VLEVGDRSCRCLGLAGLAQASQVGHLAAAHPDGGRSGERAARLQEPATADRRLERCRGPIVRAGHVVFRPTARIVRVHASLVLSPYDGAFRPSKTAQPIAHTEPSGHPDE